MPAQLVLYSWRVLDARTGRWRTLGWKMTPADAETWAQREGVKVERVENSAETRGDVDGRYLDGGPYRSAFPAVQRSS